MDADQSGLEMLSRHECLRLLSGARTGRVGFHASALPVVLPVAFAVDNLGIVVRVRAGSQLDYATRDAVVAFEADDVDPWPRNSMERLGDGDDERGNRPNGARARP